MRKQGRRHASPRASRHVVAHQLVVVTPALRFGDVYDACLGLFCHTPFPATRYPLRRVVLWYCGCLSTPATLATTHECIIPKDLQEGITMASHAVK